MKQPIKHNAEHYAALAAELNSTKSFASGIGIRILEIGYGYAKGFLEIGDTHLNGIEIAHGGCLATLADSVSGTATLGHGYHCVTSGFSFHFLKPAKEGPLICTAQETGYSDITSTVHTEITDGEGRLIASGTFDFRMFPGVPGKFCQAIT